MLIIIIIHEICTVRIHKCVILPYCTVYDNTSIRQYTHNAFAHIYMYKAFLFNSANLHEKHFVLLLIRK